MADASQHLAGAEAMATDQLKEQAGLLGLIGKEEGEDTVGEKVVVGEAFVGGSEENIKIPEGVGEKKLEGEKAENEGAARSTDVGFEGMAKEEEISKGDIVDGVEGVNSDMKEELEEETREEILLAEKVEGVSKEEDGLFKTEEGQNREEESSEEPVDSLDCLKQTDDNVEIEAEKEGGQLDVTDQRNNDEDLDKSTEKEEVAENIQSSEDEKNKEGIFKEANKEMIDEPEKEELEKSHSNYSTPAENENENGDKGTRGGFIQMESIDGLAKDIEEKTLGGLIGVADQLEGKKEEETVDKGKFEETQIPDSTDDKKENLLEMVNESLPIAMNNNAADHTMDVSPTVPQVASRESKGLLDKIKEKLPGYGAKLEEKKESAAVY